MVQNNKLHQITKAIMINNVIIRRLLAVLFHLTRPEIKIILNDTIGAIYIPSTTPLKFD